MFGIHNNVIVDRLVGGLIALILLVISTMAADNNVDDDESIGIASYEAWESCDKLVFDG